MGVGLGFGVGYLGSALGLLMALPFATDRIEVVWILVAGFFLLFSLPAFLVLPKDQATGTSVAEAARWGLTSFRDMVAEVWRLTELRNFLLAFLLLHRWRPDDHRDGRRDCDPDVRLRPAGHDRPVPDRPVSALVGAFGLAKPTDRYGPKKVLNGVLTLWAVAGVTVYLIEDPTLFYGMAVMAGLGLGSAQAASRAFMSSLIPHGKEAEMFRLLRVVRQVVVGARADDLRHSHVLGGREPAARLARLDRPVHHRTGSPAARHRPSGRDVTLVALSCPCPIPPSSSNHGASSGSSTCLLSHIRFAVFAHQAASNPMYSAIGVELLEAGMSPRQALDMMLRSDHHNSGAPC